MVNLLFLSRGGSLRAPLAAGFARSIASPGELTIHSAGVEPGPLDAQAVEVMREVGIAIADEKTQAVGELGSLALDVVIALGETGEAEIALLLGAPVWIRWPIEPLGAGSGLEAYRRVRDDIGCHVRGLLQGGHLTALVNLKRSSEVVLDNLGDGIIAHDVQRRITWFNRAAERITGYSRGEVIGRCCPDIFPGGFCGGKCSFLAGVPNFEKLQYPLRITGRDGHLRQVEMSLVAMRNHRGDFEGVLATIHDVTEVIGLRRQLRDVRSFHGIIGADEKMQAIYDLIGDLAVSDCPVLIQGESGTGKELIAGAIHGESRRAGRAFVTVNCGALPEGILESELFGHVRGAFTGAIRDKKGRFSLADGGTIFLDEVGELTANMQVKLLRVLQEGTFTPVGGEKVASVDVRVVSATNRDLREMVRQGRFREDLFYRLCVVPVTLPPLRERRNDIPLLVDHFRERLRKETKREIGAVSAEALHALLDYAWPGNIRELQNALQYAFVKCKGPVLGTEHLPPEILQYVARQPRPTGGRVRRWGKLEGRRVREALRQTRGNKLKAAAALGVGRATLYRFLAEHPEAAAGREGEMGGRG